MNIITNNDMLISFHSIVNLTYTEKEIQHTSRNRRAYHVYLSYYFHDFNAISDEKKEEVMRENKIWMEVGETETIDSTDTQRLPTCHDVSRAAGINWRNMCEYLKKGWKQRAEDLNNRPRNDGHFQFIPTSIIEASVTQCLILSLSKEWLNVVRMFRNCLLGKTNKIVNSQKVFKFGFEKVKLMNQTYRHFILSHLLIVTIFGSSPLFSVLKSHEIVYRSKKEVVVHLFSFQRVKELLTFGGMNAGSFYKHQCRTLCIPKVNLVDGDGKSIIGYVLCEEEEVLVVVAAGSGDLITRVKCPTFDVDTGAYTYGELADPQVQRCDGHYSLSHLWPFRMKINISSGHTSIIISSTTFNTDAVLMLH